VGLKLVCLLTITDSCNGESEPWKALRSWEIHSKHSLPTGGNHEKGDSSKLNMPLNSRDTYATHGKAEWVGSNVVLIRRVLIDRTSVFASYPKANVMTRVNTPSNVITFMQ
jgi:hypothetical protein